MRVLISILLLTICSSCAAQVSSPSPKQSASLITLPTPEGWMLSPSPAEDALRCANRSQHHWRVTSDRENVKISLGTQLPHQDPLPPQISSSDIVVGIKGAGARHVEQVHDGWLVGLDVGEFGGGLWWFSQDGTRNRKLSNENVVGFAKSSAGVLALVGLAHLSFDSGKVLRISEGTAGNRQIEILADLGAAPSTFVSESPDALLIVTTRDLMRVRTSGAVEKLLPIHYALLYPTSLTLLPSGVIYIGMRHFITRLTPIENGYKEEWFEPIGDSCR